VIDKNILVYLYIHKSPQLAKGDRKSVTIHPLPKGKGFLCYERIKEEHVSANTIIESENIPLIDMIANIVHNYSVNPETLIKAIEIGCSIETIQKLTNKLSYWDNDIITTTINKGDVDLLKVVLTGRKGKVGVALSLLPNDIQQVLTEHNDKY
jgi:hypothetical protein